MEQPKAEIGTKKDLVFYRLQTARSDLKSAKILLAAEEYKGANNRAYYAIFHAISAVHAVSGTAYKRHKDAIANFNKDYVKTEIFPREMGRKIGEAEEIRHASDYDDFYIASREESERQVAVADEFILLAEKYCMAQFEIPEIEDVATTEF
ncbi:MAG: HEPN domain-containing protein [Bariatricus sp.]